MGLPCCGDQGVTSSLYLGHPLNHAGAMGIAGSERIKLPQYLLPSFWEAYYPHFVDFDFLVVSCQLRGNSLRVA